MSDEFEPDLSITLTASVAEGIRRLRNRHVSEMIDRKNLGQFRQGQWKSLRGMHRETDRSLRKMFTDGCVKFTQDGPKRAEWLVTFSMASEGIPGYFCTRTFVRNGKKTIKALPIFASNHFVDRQLQSQRSGSGTLAEVLYEVDRAISGLYDLMRTGESGESDVIALWARAGTLYLATDEALVIGVVPEVGELELKTMIHRDSLEAHNEVMWRRLRSQGEPFEIHEKKQENLRQQYLERERAWIDRSEAGCVLRVHLDDMSVEWVIGQSTRTGSSRRYLFSRVKGRNGVYVLSPVPVAVICEEEGGAGPLSVVKVSETVQLVERMDRELHSMYRRVEVVRGGEPAKEYFWSRVGILYFATENRLVVGKVPREGFLVIVMILPPKAMDEATETMWKALRKSEAGYVIVTS